MNGNTNYISHPRGLSSSYRFIQGGEQVGEGERRSGSPGGDYIGWEKKKIRVRRRSVDSERRGGGSDRLGKTNPKIDN